MKLRLMFLIYYTAVCISLSAQQCGCTDSLAYNYDPTAIFNDGSCLYPSATIYPRSSYYLDNILCNTSGILYYRNLLWTHNDHADACLYGITTTAVLSDTIRLSYNSFTDMEDIAQDDQFIYMGDFGNNLTGNRTDLHILKIDKTNYHVDTLFFHYDDQTDFSEKPTNQTNYDCEAMVVVGDSIYLFSKRWLDNYTTLYKMSAAPGEHTAQKCDSLFVDGLITGATYIAQNHSIVLCGYNHYLMPFFYLLYDYHAHNFFSGNKRKIGITLYGYQIEAVDSEDGGTFYATNERSSYLDYDFPAQLFSFDLSSFLPAAMKAKEYAGNRTPFIQNPVQSTIQLFRNDNQPYRYTITNLRGTTIQQGTVDCRITLPPALSAGLYLLILENEKGERTVLKFVKQ